MKKSLFLSIVLFSSNILATTYDINDSDLVGDVMTVSVEKGDSFYKIARANDLGLLELKEANPRINPNKLKVGQKIIVPTQFILPPGIREGIVINLAELRLYYYKDNTVSTYPVGTGRIGWKTPTGSAKIIKKKAYPTWYPPKSIRASYEKKGVTLPASIGPGPKNPLGDFAMYLNWPAYLIHGTNQPASVGLRSSSGCMRMYPEDIESLFQKVPKGTKVTVIHEPFKVGTENGQLYLEAHEPFQEKYYWDQDEIQDATDTIAKIFRLENIDWHKTQLVLDNTIGFPMPINQ